MNEQFEKLMYKSGLTAQGCWDEMDSYMHDAIKQFAELIVRECVNWIDGSPTTEEGTLILSKCFIIANLKQHFGVEE